MNGTAHTEFFGGPLDGETKRLPVMVKDFYLPIPMPIQPIGIDTEGAIPEAPRRLVHHYEQRVVRSVMNEPPIVRMYYKGETTK